MALNNFELRK